jgi:hypothetical protein
MWMVPRISPEGSIKVTAASISEGMKSLITAISHGILPL